MEEVSSRKIVVGVDSSDASDRAFQWILHNVVKKSDHIFVLNSVPLSNFDLPDADLPNGMWIYFLSVLNLQLGLLLEGDLRSC